MFLSVDESLTLGHDLELELEVRPVADSGLLLHAGVRKSQQLSIYLNHGEVRISSLQGCCTSNFQQLSENDLVFSSVQVVVLLNNGSGEFPVSLKPQDSLCDGHWHSIFSK